MVVVKPSPGWSLYASDVMVLFVVVVDVAVFVVNAVVAKEEDIDGKHCLLRKELDR